MRVLHVIPDLGSGGAERLVLDICRALGSRRGVESRLITFRETCAYPDDAAHVDWRVIPSRYVPRALHPAIRETAALDQAIRTYRPDVIHLHLVEADMVVRSLNIAGPAYLTHLHSTLPALERPLPWSLTSRTAVIKAWDRRVLLRLYRRLGVTFLAVSSHVAAWARRTFDPRWTVITRPNAIDLERFRPLPRQAPSGAIRLVSIGRLVPEKNQALQIGALARLRELGVTATLDIIGEGPEERALRDTTNALGLAGQVRLLGRVTPINDALLDHDMLIHSAVREPFGLALLEAMANGLPVICTDGGAVREVVSDGTAGFIVVPTADALAEGIMAAVHSPDRYRQLSRGATAWSRRFGIEAYLNSLLEHYSAAVRTRSERPAPL